MSFEVGLVWQKNSMAESKLDSKSSSPVDRSAALVYPLYTKALEENNALDFDDLLLFPLKVFKKTLLFEKIPRTVQIRTGG